MLTCLWAVKRNKPTLPGAVAAAGQDVGGIFFSVLVVVIFNSSKLATPGANKISKCLPRLQ